MFGKRKPQLQHKRTNYRIRFQKILKLNLIAIFVACIIFIIYTFVVGVRRFIILKHISIYFILLPLVCCLSYGVIWLIFLIFKLHRKISNERKIRKHYNELIRSMSHDIKAPINTIIGLSKLSREYLDDKHKLLENFDKIEKSSIMSLKLINRLLELTKCKRVSIIRSRFTLEDLIDEVRTVILPQAINKNIDFFIGLKGVNTEFFYSDFIKLYEVLVNLLSNSIKYTNRNGKVSLVIIEDGIYEKSQGLVNDFSKFIFVIEDNGIGMDDETILSIFTPYKRGKNGLKEEGHGLGMTITKVLTEVLYGDLYVNSRLNEGTKFTLELPMCLDYEKVNSIKQSLYYRNFKYKFLNVLYLDDDNHFDGLNNEFINKAFNDLQMNVKFSCDIEDIEKFAFVFADLYKLSTYKVKLLKRANELLIPIIIVSNNIDNSIKEYNVKRICEKPITRYGIYKVLNEIDFKDVKTMIHEEKEKLNILLCDDTEMNLDILAALLEKNNYNVDKASNGVLGLELFINSSINYYSYVITDLRMPEMNGYEMAKNIRALNRSDKDITIIGVSGDSDKEDIRRAMESGIDRLLEKPVKIEELLRILEMYERSKR